MYAIFNTISKEFIGFSPSEAITTGNILYKDVGKVVDIGLYMWKGDYETGALVPKTSVNAVIDEYKLEKKLFEKIARKYPLMVQLKIIIDQLDEIIKEEDQTGDFTCLKRDLTLLQANRLTVQGMTLAPSSTSAYRPRMATTVPRSCPSGNCFGSLRALIVR